VPCPQFRLVLACSVAILLLTLSQSDAADPETEPIFPLQGKHVHSSSIVECPNGDLLAVWFYGSGERSADDVQLQGARLRKGAKAWSPVFVMADTPDVPDCNPVLYIDAKERLWLFWIVVQTNRWERSILKYRRAEKFTADGPPEWSWQDIILLKPGADFQAVLRDGFKELNFSEPMWAEYALPYTEMLIEAAGDPYKRQTGWMTRTRPLTLPSGRFLLPLYSDGFNACLMGISDDGGETWRASKPIVGLGPIQPTLARRSNGEIVAYCRDSGVAPGRILESTSKDDGESWSLARDIDIPNSGSSLALLGLKDGRWVLVCNDTEEGRHQLAVMLSEDEGRSWPHKRYLEKAEPGDASFSYPTAIQSRDGRVHVSYSHSVRAGGAKSGAAIKHASFEVGWIVEGAETQE
jgi:predicted neuraminidase